jgi:hypothetical protein
MGNAGVSIVFTSEGAQHTGGFSLTPVDFSSGKSWIIDMVY